MATNTTHRTDTGEDVVWANAVAAWAAAGRLVLERVAATYGAYLTYQEMSQAVQEESRIVTGVPFRHWIGRVLALVAADRRAADEPMLTSLVVRADGTIGEGYVGPVRDRDGAEPGDLDLHAAEERLRCYRYFGADIPSDGGRARLTRQLSQRRSRPTKQTVLPRKVCPNCFVQLPLTGRCDTCEA